MKMETKYEHLINNLRLLENHSAVSYDDQLAFEISLIGLGSNRYMNVKDLFDGIKFLRNINAVKRYSETTFEVKIPHDIDLMSAIYVPYNIESMMLEINGHVIENYYLGHQHKDFKEYKHSFVITKDNERKIGGWIKIGKFFKHLPIFLIKFYEIKLIIKLKDINLFHDEFPVSASIIHLCDKKRKELAEIECTYFSFETTNKKLEYKKDNKMMEII